MRPHTPKAKGNFHNKSVTHSFAAEIESLNVGIMRLEFLSNVRRLKKAAQGGDNWIRKELANLVATSYKWITYILNPTIYEIILNWDFQPNEWR